MLDMITDSFAVGATNWLTKVWAKYFHLTVIFITGLPRSPRTSAMAITVLPSKQRAPPKPRKRSFGFEFLGVQWSYTWLWTALLAYEESCATGRSWNDHWVSGFCVYRAGGVKIKLTSWWRLLRFSVRFSSRAIRECSYNPATTIIIPHWISLHEHPRHVSIIPSPLLGEK